MSQWEIGLLVGGAALSLVLAIWAFLALWSEFVLARTEQRTASAQAALERVNAQISALEPELSRYQRLEQDLRAEQAPRPGRAA